jgi:toxin ParE1/3/4
MLPFRLTPDAEARLEAIGNYTEQNWGYTQREKYLLAMDACFQRLAAKPMQGRERHDLREGLYSYPQGSHVIYYLVRNEYIIIVDILHESMEPGLHMAPVSEGSMKISH